MNEQIFFAAVSLNIIGATCLAAVVGIVLLQAPRARLNRLLALYIGICLVWSLTALIGRFVMTSTVFSGVAQDDRIVFNLVIVIILALAGNSPFLFAFIVEYVGLSGEKRWQIAKGAAYVINLLIAIVFVFRFDWLIDDYGITSVGMISITPKAPVYPLLGLAYFFWYALSIYLVVRHGKRESKWLLFGIVTIASGLAIEVLTEISDILPVAIVSSGIGAIAFGYTILQDNIFNPLERANHNYQKTQRNLEEIISAIPGSVMITTLAGKILWANQYSAEMLCLPYPELMQSNISDFYQDIADRQLVKTALQKEGGLADFQYQFKRHDGVIRFGRMTVLPMRYNDEDALLGIVNDIHDQKMAETSLQQMQKFESLAVLAGGIAHDFNNLLVAMLAQSSIAKIKLDDEHPAYKHIGKVETAANKAATLTQQMLAYSGKGSFAIRPLLINDVIQQNLDFLDATIPKHVQLNVSYDQALPLVLADPAQMQQIIMNLIINAAEAIGSGAGQITIKTVAKGMNERLDGVWIQKMVDAQKPHILITVADSGVGISAEKINQIFDPFYTTKETGSGLGLSAVVGIVRAHKGGLLVNSKLDEGTQFAIFLPVNSSQITYLPSQLERHPIGSD